MAKDKRQRRLGVVRVLKQKRTGPRILAERADGAADPMGSCRYADALGQMQCESPVTKSYCDSNGGFFTPDGRC